MQTQMSANGANRVAMVLGYAGLIPFVVSVALLWHPTLRGLGIGSLFAYAAVILSFIGAVHWGVALGGGQAQPDSRYVLSVLPALAAWCCVLLPQRYALPLLAAAFVGWWLWERTLPERSLPPWYLQLRSHLTLVVVLSLAIAWLRLNVSM